MACKGGGPAEEPEKSVRAAPTRCDEEAPATSRGGGSIAGAKPAGGSGGRDPGSSKLAGRLLAVARARSCATSRRPSSVLRRPLCIRTWSSIPPLPRGIRAGGAAAGGAAEDDPRPFSRATGGSSACLRARRRARSRRSPASSCRRAARSASRSSSTSERSSAWLSTWLSRDSSESYSSEGALRRDLRELWAGWCPPAVSSCSFHHATIGGGGDRRPIGTAAPGKVMSYSSSAMTLPSRVTVRYTCGFLVWDPGAVERTTGGRLPTAVTRGAPPQYAPNARPCTKTAKPACGH